MLSEDKGVCIVDAMKALYSSEVYSKLEDESTKEFRSGGNCCCRKSRHGKVEKD